MEKCSTCAGTGKITIQVSEYPNPPKPCVLDCIDCDGAGLITPEKGVALRRLRERMKTFWCKCSSPSHTTFHDDTPDAKHHWTCDDCGKVTQVG